MGLFGCKSNNKKEKKKGKDCKESADCEVEINLYQDVCNFSVIAEIPGREMVQNEAPPWYNCKIKR